MGLEYLTHSRYSTDVCFKYSPECDFLNYISGSRIVRFLEEIVNWKGFYLSIVSRPVLSNNDMVLFNYKFKLIKIK